LAGWFTGVLRTNIVLGFAGQCGQSGGLAESFSYRAVGIRSNAVLIRSRALTGKGFAVSTQ
jgi:hypothetical protein